MGLLTLVLIVIVVLAVIGLGLNVFLEGVKKGLNKTGISSIIENTTKNLKNELQFINFINFH